jgi:EAL domain-containing protein (putative c-di-GMP-specific phosphodiesterase class I)
MADWQLPLISRGSVNSSPVQFADFVRTIRCGILEDTELEPALLSPRSRGCGVAACDAVVEASRRLRSMGVKVGLDNGVGASSLAPCRRWPSIGSIMPSSRMGSGGRELVQAIVNLAHGLSLEVVGEGRGRPGKRLSSARCERVPRATSSASRWRATPPVR